MKTRQELVEDAELIVKQRIKSIEITIAAAVARRQDKVEVHCSEQEYFILKGEIEAAGFRTTYYESSGHKVYISKMTIHL